MKTSAKHTCRQLAGLLEQYGVTDIVVSPGTRNAPIVMALHRSGAYRLHHCVDERSAAFRALGLAIASGLPVAMTCTSGTAMLNYGPALAEAFYSRVPLIAITADRPARWIDQRDSQTIRQPGALDAFVRCSVDIADDCDPEWSNRLINDALHAATGNIPGPVHINVQLDAPLTGEVDVNPADDGRKIEVFRPAPDAQSIEAFIRRALSPCENGGSDSPASKVMLFICGMMPHEAETIRPLLKELRTSGIAIVPEIQSSLTDCATVTAGALEAALQRREIADELYPDVLITIGGSAVSATIKAWLRRCPTLRHISVGFDDNAVDTYGHLAATVDCSPAAFLAALTDQMCLLCGSLASREYSAHLSPAFAPQPLVALVSAAVKSVGAALHISNGMSIRLMQGAPVADTHVWCNRGVSGIDGSTSTAMGAAAAHPDRPLLLVTGDMSAAYDIGALADPTTGGNFNMLVVDNGGGDIFRRIKPTRDLPEREQYLTAMPLFPLAALADAYGFAYVRATAAECTEEMLTDVLRSNKKTIIHLITDQYTAS